MSKQKECPDCFVPDSLIGRLFDLLPLIDDTAEPFGKEIADAAYDFDEDVLKVRFRKKEDE